MKSHVSGLRYRSFCLMVLSAAYVITAQAQEAGQGEKIDASDPTKIYSYAGGGAKYTDYTNDATMTEVRVTGNLGLSDKDMMLFELGYGQHSGAPAAGSDGAMTNSRIRWFHLFKMDHTKTRGYRGVASQVDLQLAGDLKGTDGQNTLALGGLVAIAISNSWNFYTGANLVNTWDKDFVNWNGSGVAATALFVYVPRKLWEGAFFQIWPSYTSFQTGDLSGEGSGNLDLITGGNITDKILWSVTYQKNFDRDLGSYRRGAGTGLTNDWNIFFSITSYF